MLRLPQTAGRCTSLTERYWPGRHGDAGHHCDGRPASTDSGRQDSVRDSRDPGWPLAVCGLVGWHGDARCRSQRQAGPPDPGARRRRFARDLAERPDALRWRVQPDHAHRRRCWYGGQGDQPRACTKIVTIDVATRTVEPADLAITPDGRTLRTPD